MLIVTGGSNNYPFHLTIRYNEKMCKQFGYAFRAYDLGGLGFGTSVDDPRCASKFRRVKSAMKPGLILDAMTKTDERLVVWVDGDATLIRPIDELLEDDSFDIGLTVRGKPTVKKTHYINAGVIIVKNNERGKKFIEDWVDAMPPVPCLDTEKKPLNYSDQKTLEEIILLPNIDVVPWDAFFSVHEVHGARVKFFECRKYNNFGTHSLPDWKAPPEDAKIIHFKGHRMESITQYAEDFLNG